MLRVDNGAPTSKPPSPAAPAFGGQLAARLAGATDPDVLAVLQSRTVDQRVLATLAVIAATQPVRVEDISTIEGEDDTGTPRRDITLRARATGYKLWRHSSNARWARSQCSPWI